MSGLGTFLLAFSLVIQGSISLKVAVVQHKSTPYESTPLKTELGNVQAYLKDVEEAARQGAKLITFPEHGLFGYGEFPIQQDHVADLYNVYLPAEAVGSWNPCDDPKKYNGADDPGNTYEVLQLVSCGARNHSIVIMLNTVTRRLCPSDTTACPSSGSQVFNTNIFFAANGTIIAVYHKRHLFDDPDVDAAPVTEYVIVDIDGTDMGSFICFDFMFPDPAFDLVSRYGIRNIIFANAFIDELPFYTTNQYVLRYAMSQGVNILAPDQYDPINSVLGSGIYSSSQGVLVETYDLAQSNRVLIADLPDNPLPVKQDSFACDFSAPDQPLKPVNQNAPYEYLIYTDVPSSKPWNKTHKIYYEFLDNYTYQFLSQDQETLTLCQGDLCCQLEYRFSSNANSHYVFAVNNGLRYFKEYPVYQQVCSVLRCESEDINTCGRVPKRPITGRAQFSSLTLTGSFATNLTFPGMTGIDLQNYAASSWSYSAGACTSNTDRFKAGAKISLLQTNQKVGLFNAVITARVPDRD